MCSKSEVDKDSVKGIRRQVTDGEKIFSKGTCDKGLLSKTFKRLLKLNNKKLKKFFLKNLKKYTVLIG